MTDQITVPRETWDPMREALVSAANFISPYSRGEQVLEKVDAALTAANAVSHPKPETAPPPEGGAITSESAANAVSAPKGLFVDLIASHGPEFVAEMAALSLTNEGDMLAKQPEILAEYTGINGHRQWASVGAWLYEGDAIAVISDHFRGVTKMVQPLGWYCVSRDGIATQCADQRDAEMTAKSGNRDWPNSAPYRAVQLCEFEAHPQAPEPAWRPIETAPKDESEILLGHPDGSMVVGWWRENGLHGRVSGWSDGDDFAMTWPSHWMPLPAAPEEKQ